MGPEGLLFCPIFWRAFTHTHTNRFPLFVAQSLAGCGNCTTEGSALASSAIGRLTTLRSRIPNPNRTDHRPILTHSWVFVRSSCTKITRGCRLYLLAAEFRVRRWRIWMKVVLAKAAEISGAPPPKVFQSDCLHPSHGTKFVISCPLN